MTRKDTIVAELGALIARVEEVTEGILAASELFNELYTRIGVVLDTVDETVDSLAAVGVSAQEFLSIKSRLDELYNEVSAVKEGVEQSVDENTGLRATAESIQEEANSIK